MPKLSLCDVVAVIVVNGKIYSLKNIDMSIELRFQVLFSTSQN